MRVCYLNQTSIFPFFFHTKNGQACEMGYYGPKAGVHILTEYGIVVGL